MDCHVWFDDMGGGGGIYSIAQDNYTYTSRVEYIYCEPQPSSTKGSRVDASSIYQRPIQSCPTDTHHTKHSKPPPHGGGITHTVGQSYYYI